MVRFSLDGIRVALLATDGVEQVALTTPRAALEAAGAWVRIVAPNPDRVTAWHGGGWGSDFPVDVPLFHARAEDFDALLVPGGIMGSASLRADPLAVAFVRAFDAQEKPISAICHGPWLLAAAGIVRDRRVAAWPTLERELRAAGARWVDAPAVLDGRLLTCRTQLDLASFMRQTIEQLAGSAATTTH